MQKIYQIKTFCVYCNEINIMKGFLFMIAYKEYNRLRAVQYAKRWALERNPLFIDFAGRGGDCTNFVSQCILAGCCTMNFTPDFGWYYIDSNDRAPAWSSVEFLYDFLMIKALRAVRSKGFCVIIRRLKSHTVRVCF